MLSSSVSDGSVESNLILAADRKELIKVYNIRNITCRIFACVALSGALLHNLNFKVLQRDCNIFPKPVEQLETVFIQPPAALLPQAAADVVLMLLIPLSLQKLLIASIGPAATNILTTCCRETFCKTSTRDSHINQISFSLNAFKFKFFYVVQRYVQ